MIERFARIMFAAILLSCRASSSPYINPLSSGKRQNRPR